MVDLPSAPLALVNAVSSPASPELAACIPGFGGDPGDRFGPVECGAVSPGSIRWMAWDIDTGLKVALQVNEGWQLFPLAAACLLKAWEGLPGWKRWSGPP